MPHNLKYCWKILHNILNHQSFLLQAMCEQFLCRQPGQIRVENAADLLLLGWLHNSEMLKEKVADFIGLNCVAVMKTEGWDRVYAGYPELIKYTFEQMAKKCQRATQ
jgi:hypothetical protein